jgi:hypothetical protein
LDQGVEQGETMGRQLDLKKDRPTPGQDGEDGSQDRKVDQEGASSAKQGGRQGKEKERTMGVNKVSHRFEYTLSPFGQSRERW